MAGLYNTHESEIRGDLNLARAAIVTNVYPKLMGFGPQHEVDIDTFLKENSTFWSRELGNTFLGGRVCLGALDGGYKASEKFGGIQGSKDMFNAMRNKRYTMNKVRKLFKT